MDELRLAGERGHAEHGWLDSWHSFSFADYHDPKHMGWGALRVINEDRVQPGQGFGTHGHRDMEIISYVLEGALQYEVEGKPPMTLKAGEVLFIPAGTVHAAKNTGRVKASELATYILEKGKPALTLVK